MFVTSLDLIDWKRIILNDELTREKSVSYL